MDKTNITPTGLLIQFYKENVVNAGDVDGTLPVWCSTDSKYPGKNIWFRLEDASRSTEHSGEGKCVKLVVYTIVTGSEFVLLEVIAYDRDVSMKYGASMMVFKRPILCGEFFRINHDILARLKEMCLVHRQAIVNQSKELAKDPVVLKAVVDMVEAQRKEKQFASA